MNEKLRVTLVLDDKDFHGRLYKNGKLIRQTGDAADRLAKKSDNAAKSTRNWGASLRSAVITFAAFKYAVDGIGSAFFGFQGAIIKANAELERATAIMGQFSTASTAAARAIEANDAVGFIIQRASEAPFSINALTDSFVKLKVGGLDPLNGSFNALTDAVAAFGGTDEQLKRASVAISQMQGKGVVSMEELRQQLAEAVPSAAQIMARSLNTTYSELTALIATGTVASEPALTAMFRQMELEMGGSAIRMMDTWNGLVAQLKSRLIVLAKEFGDSGYFDAVKQQLEDFVTLLKDPAAAEAARSIGESVAAMINAIRAGVDTLIKYKDEIKTLITLYASFKIAQFASTKAVDAWTSTVGRATSISGKFSQYSRIIAATKRKEAQAYAKADYAVRAYTNKLDKVGNMSKTLSGTMYSLRDSMAATDVRMARATRSAARMAVVMGTLRSAVSWLPQIAIPLMISGLATWAMKTKEVARAQTELIEKVRQGTAAFYTAEEIKKSQGHLDQLTKDREKWAARQETLLVEMSKRSGRQVEEIRSTIESGGEFGRLERIDVPFAAAREEFEKLSKQMIAANNEASSLEAGLEKAMKVFTLNSVDSDINLVERLFAFDRNDLQAKLKSQIKEIEDETNKALKEEGGDQKAIMEERTKRLAEVYEQSKKAQLALLQSTYEARVKEISTGENKVTAEQLKIFKEQYGAMYAEMEEVLSRGVKNLNEAVLTGDDDEQDEAKFKKLATYVVGLQNKLSNLQNTLSGGNGVTSSVDNFKRKLSLWGIELEESSVAFQNIKKLLTDIASAEGQIKLDKQADKITASIDKLETKYSALLQKSQRQSSGGGLFKALTAEDQARADIKKIEDQITSLNEELKKLEETGGDTSGVIEQIAAAKKRLGDSGDIISNARLTDTNNLLAQTLALQTKYGAKIKANKQSANEYYGQKIQFLDDEIKRLQEAGLLTDELKVAMDQLRGIFEDLQQQRGASPFAKMMEEWSNFDEMLSQTAVDSVGAMVDSLTELSVKGKTSFSDFRDFVLEAITKMILKMMVFNAISGAQGFFGGGSSQDLGASRQGYTAAFGFADGGIMSKSGKLPLRAYQNGGIANSPQLALFGEGAMNEAYVPLPDGKTIPVTMTGGGMPGVMINIENNGNPVDAEVTQTRYDGENYVVNVVMKELSRPSRLRQAVRGVK